jgi:hypothetical protein
MIRVHGDVGIGQEDFESLSALARVVRGFREGIRGEQRAFDELALEPREEVVHQGLAALAAGGPCRSAAASSPVSASFTTGRTISSTVYEAGCWASRYDFFSEISV